MGAERRQHIRIDVAVPVRVYLSGNPNTFKGMIENISFGGAFVRCDAKVERGQKVLIHMEQAGEAPSIKAEVAPDFAKDFAEDPDSVPNTSVVRWAKTPEGFGVEFLELSHEVLRYLQKVLDEAEGK